MTNKLKAAYKFFTTPSKFWTIMNNFLVGVFYANAALFIAMCIVIITR